MIGIVWVISRRQVLKHPRDGGERLRNAGNQQRYKTKVVEEGESETLETGILRTVERVSHLTKTLTRESVLTVFEVVERCRRIRLNCKSTSVLPNEVSVLGSKN